MRYIRAGFVGFASSITGMWFADYFRLQGSAWYFVWLLVFVVFLFILNRED